MVFRRLPFAAIAQPDAEHHAHRLAGHVAVGLASPIGGRSAAYPARRQSSPVFPGDARLLPHRCRRSAGCFGRFGCVGSARCAAPVAGGCQCSCCCSRSLRVNLSYFFLSGFFCFLDGGFCVIAIRTTRSLLALDCLPNHKPRSSSSPVTTSSATACCPRCERNDDASSASRGRSSKSMRPN